MPLIGLLVLAACGVAGCGEEGPTAVPLVNHPPTAAFAANCADLTCMLTNQSADDDGAIVAQAWDFGDGETSTQVHPTHTYAAPGGDFTVTLTVTDDGDGTATTVRQVSARPSGPTNNAPAAGFTSACTVLTCTFTDQSRDPDPGGMVVSHAWDFGDGATSTVQSPDHQYAHPGGRFTVTLSVADDQGAVDTTSGEVTVAWVDWPDVSGIYERETPHGTAGRDSRIVVHSDGRLELFDWTGADTTAYEGRWSPLDFWSGHMIEPGTAIGIDFDAFERSEFCGEAYGTFLMTDRLAVAFCRPGIEAGLEEGVYSSVPGTAGTLPPPQSGQIAFVRDGRIFRVDTDGGGLIQLTDGPTDHDPAWSPDGQRLAFGRSGADPGIYVMDADGSNLFRLTETGDDPYLHVARSPTWSHDGAWIAFVCIRNSEATLCKLNTDGSSQAVPINSSLRGQVSSPSWSPDGARIAFVSDWNFFDNWFDIWYMAPDGSGMTALTTHTPGAPNPWEFYQPAWSPDGARIAFATCPWSWVKCSSSAVSVMNSGGLDVVRLVAAGGFPDPTWSPDGEVIAYTSANAIEWISADGHQRGRIVDDGSSPRWRP